VPARNQKKMATKKRKYVTKHSASNEYMGTKGEYTCPTCRRVLHIFPRTARLYTEQGECTPCWLNRRNT